MATTKAAAAVKTAPKKSEETVKVSKPKAASKKANVDYIYAVGRRKRSIARVRMHQNGSGKITINDRAVNDYFTITELRNAVTKPLEVVNKLKDFDITVKVVGGGVRGQAEATRHGISRALLLVDADLRALLKPEGFLHRDPRRKERKKPGLKKARRAPQFAKR